MPEIKTREINGQLFFVASCDYCGKEFAYPYQKQTENNVLSHMKFCKYKTRNAPEPTIKNIPPQQITPEINYKEFYEKYHKIIEQFKQQGIVP